MPRAAEPAKGIVLSLLKRDPPFGPTYIRQWRKHRGLSLERLADRLHTTHATLSRIERGRQPYNQALLEALADALGCEPADLLMRDPLDPEAPWSLWEKLKPEQRKQAMRLLKVLAAEEVA